MQLSKSILPCLLLLAATVAHAQIIFDDKPSIDAKLLAGVWVSADTFKYKIEFKDEGYDMTLRSVPPDFFYYFSKDSTGQVSSSGYYPQWPPHGCDLKVLAGDTLQVGHSQIGPPYSVVKYVKEY